MDYVIDLLRKDRALLAEDEAEKLRHVNAAKTILQWLTFAFNEGWSDTVTAYVVHLLPPLFSLPETSEDVEMHNLCHQALGLMSQTLVNPGCVSGIMEALAIGARSESWHARRRVLLFVQVFAFRNLFAVNGDEVLELVRPLLADTRLEVSDAMPNAIGR